LLGLIQNLHWVQDLVLNLNTLAAAAAAASSTPLVGSGAAGQAIYIKTYLKAKEELWKLKYFTMQIYNLQEIPLKETKNPSRYYNSITNLKFQHKPKISSVKNPHIKTDLFLPRDQNPLSHYTL